MPSGAKKRKAAKKKKVHNSSTPQGENDVGELSSPVSQNPSMEGEVKKNEENSSEIIKSNSVDKNSNEEESGNIEIEIGSKSKSSNGSSSSSSSGSSDDEVEKKIVVLESAPIESLPENITQKDEDLEVISPVVKPVDSLDDVSQDCDDEPKNDEKKDLVVEEKETVVVSENEFKDDCLTSSVVVESVLKDSISEVNGANRANDDDTIGHSDRQPPVAASTPLTVQKTTSWKSCCGMFELFSGSER